VKLVKLVRHWLEEESVQRVRLWVSLVENPGLEVGQEKGWTEILTWQVDFLAFDFLPEVPGVAALKLRSLVVAWQMDERILRRSL
jgi:hypothetical protein